MKRFLPFILAMALGVNQVQAQIFSPLPEPGGMPFDGLVLSVNTLYGTTSYGGTNGYGAVFAINSDGTGFTNLYNFSSLNVDSPSGTNSNGAFPFGGLFLSGGILYGTTSSGGTNGYGTVFAIRTNGADLTDIHTFGSDSGNSIANLILSGNTLYGTTWDNATSGDGVIFKVNVDGTDFTNLYDFTALNSGTNADGANPYAGLVLSGDILYGTTYHGGTSGYGTIFKISTDGSDFTNLYNFTGGSDGANPQACLILSGNTLYGTAEYGGTNDNGTVFAVNADGSNFTVLHTFSALDSWYYTNDDGANPVAGLLLSGNTLYGTTLLGGTNGEGAIFEIDADGTCFTNLYNFKDGSDGANPAGGLVLSGNTLYGTVNQGGADAPVPVGAFALSLGPIPLSIQSSGQTPIITWGNPAFSLQTASVSAGPWTTLSNAASPFAINTTNARAFFQLVSTNSQ